MGSLIQYRRGTAVDWRAVNPVLAAGEPGYETDTKRRKMGDGYSLWTDLPYALDTSTVGTAVTPLLTAQVPPLVAQSLAADSTVSAAAAAAVTANIGGRSLVEATDTRLSRRLSLRQKIVWAVRSSTGQPAWNAVGDDGGPIDAGVAVIRKTLKSIPGVVTRGSSTTGVAGGVIDSNRRAGENVVDVNTGRTPQGILDSWAQRINVLLFKRGRRLNVMADGTGDFLSPKLANDWILTQPVQGWRWEVFIGPGVYTETQWYPADNAFFRGAGMGKTVLFGQGANSDPDTIVNIYSTVVVTPNSRFSDLTIAAKNHRYAVHADFGAINPDTVQMFDRCELIHYGNQSAQDWRVANPGSGLSTGTIWIDPPAYGAGTASGQENLITGATLTANGHALAMHNNGAFSRPSILRVEDTVLSSTAATQAILLAALGSGTPDRLELVRVKSNGLFIRTDDQPWRGAAPYVADHNEIRVTASGCSPLGWKPNLTGTALRITSASTGAVSTVRVTGPAAALIYGAETVRDGGGGLQGYAYGYLDISGSVVGGPPPAYTPTAVANTLGKRLGTLAAPSTMTVTTETGTATVTFAAGSYAAVANDTILATINTALGSLGTADAYNPGNGEHYPRQVDKELVLKNNTPAGIPKWSAVTFDTSSQTVKIMPLDAPASDFVGIALFPIPPGATGRVLQEGVLTVGQGVPGALARDAVMYLSDVTAGLLATTGTRAIGKGVSTADNALYFKATRSI